MQRANADLALQTNKAKLLAVFEKYGVMNPRLFGSVARGEADAHSDIDILVCKTAPMDYATIARLRREVDEALGWPAHVVFESALKPEVRAEIKSDLRPLLGGCRRNGWRSRPFSKVPLFCHTEVLGKSQYLPFRAGPLGGEVGWCADLRVLATLQAKQSLFCVRSSACGLEGCVATSVFS